MTTSTRSRALLLGAVLALLPARAAAAHDGDPDQARAPVEYGVGFGAFQVGVVIAALALGVGGIRRGTRK